MAPPKSAGSSKHAKEKGEVGNSNHESAILEEASGLTTSSTKTNLSDIKGTRRLLKVNNLLISVDDDSLSVKGKEIMEKAKALIGAPRLSPKNPERLKTFLKKRKQKEFASEDTFMDIVWQILIGSERTVLENPEDQDRADAEVLVKQWHLDHLDHSRNGQFSPNSIPLVNTKNDPHLEALLEKLPGVKNPRPDLAYGLSEDTFTEEENSANIRLNQIAELSSTLFHPFFVMEFKSHKGQLSDAVNQACRGGAAMVQAMAQVEEEAGHQCRTHYDDGSFAFSLALNTDNAEFYGHWREPAPKGKHVYFMQPLNAFSLKFANPVNELRAAINNVLDWGVLDRKKHVKSLLNAIEKKLVEAHFNKKKPGRKVSWQGSGEGSGRDLGGTSRSEKQTAKSKGKGQAQAESWEELSDDELGTSK